MFSGASNFSADVDKTFIFIISISLFFLVGLTTTMIVFAVKYRKSKHPKPVQIKENMWLEVIWIIVPLIVALAMFWYGYVAFMPTRNIPEGAMPIKVIGKMWDWTFDYGNNKIIKDTMVVPINKAIKLEMTSPDVTHNLYIPAFRIKEDVVPGQTTYMWFIGERLGTFEIMCAEYCGLQHSYMYGKVIVVPEDTFELWLANLKADTTVKPAGFVLLQNNGCMACHTLDGSKSAGPTFKGLYGSRKVVVTNGKEREITVDADYLKTSITEPNNDIVKGFSKGMMNSYKGIIKDEDIDKIIEYLKSTNDK